MPYGPQITFMGPADYDIQGLTKKQNKQYTLLTRENHLGGAASSFEESAFFKTVLEGEKIKLGPLEKEEISSQNSNL